MSTNLEVFNIYQTRFIYNIKGGGSDKYRCDEPQCINYFDGKLRSAEEMTMSGFFYKPEGYVNGVQQVGLKRASDSESSFYIPPKRFRAKDTSTLSPISSDLEESFSSFKIAQDSD